METMTITVKTKKAKRIIEDLAVQNELFIEMGTVNLTKGVSKNKVNKVDISMIPENQRSHAKEILSAYKQAKKALDRGLPLKSAKDFLNEL